MRKSFVFLASLAAAVPCASTAAADTAFNVEPIVALESTKQADPSVEGSLAHVFQDSKFGVSGFWWVTKDWAEFHGGPTYAFASWLTLGADLGVEQDGQNGLGGRYAVNAWISKGDFSASGCFEWGKPVMRGEWSNAWYDAQITYTPFARFTGGARARRAIGIGPYVQVNVPEVNTKLWLLWAAADPGRPPAPPFSSALFGLTFEFK